MSLPLLQQLLPYVLLGLLLMAAYLKKLYLFTLDPDSGCEASEIKTASLSERGKDTRTVRTWNLGRMIFRYPFS